MSRPPLMAVARLLSADQSFVSIRSATTHHHSVIIARIALLSRSQSVAAHTHVSVTDTSARILVRLHAHQATPDTSLILTSVVQLPDVARSQQQPLHHTSLILVPIPLLTHTQLVTSTQLHQHQLRPQPLSPLSQHQSVLMSQAMPDSTVRSGQLPIASHVAVPPQVSSSAQPLSATPQHHVPPTSTSQPHTRLMLAAHQSAALRSSVSRHARTSSVQRLLSQLANTTRTARSVLLMLTAVATSTTASATRTSATILASAHAHQALSDRLLILMLAAQLLDVAIQQLLPVPRPHHTLHEPLHTPFQLQPSAPPHQSSVLTVRVASVNTVSAGHTRRSHA